MNDPEFVSRTALTKDAKSNKKVLVLGDQNIKRLDQAKLQVRLARVGGIKTKNNMTAHNTCYK